MGNTHSSPVLVYNKRERMGCRLNWLIKERNRLIQGSMTAMLFEWRVKTIRNPKNSEPETILPWFSHLCVSTIIFITHNGILWGVKFIWIYKLIWRHIQWLLVQFIGAWLWPFRLWIVFCIPFLVLLFEDSVQLENRKGNETKWFLVNLFNCACSLWQGCILLRQSQA